jgi:hypothetical protein
VIIYKLLIFMFLNFFEAALELYKKAISNVYKKIKTFRFSFEIRYEKKLSFDYL